MHLSSTSTPTPPESSLLQALSFKLAPRILCVAGLFPYIPFYDAGTPFLESPFLPFTDFDRSFAVGPPHWYLSPHSHLFSVATRRRNVQEGVYNCRVCQIHDLDDLSRRIVAVSRFSWPRVIQVLDITTTPSVKMQSENSVILALGYHKDAIFGLDSVCFPGCAPLVVSGATEVLASNSETGKVVGGYCDAPYLTKCLRCSRRNRSMFVGGEALVKEKGSLLMYDLERRDRAGKFRGHGATVWDISVDESCGVVYSASGDGTVKAWSLRDQHCFESMDIDDAYSLFYCEDKNRLIVGSGNGIEFWDSRKLESRISTFRPNPRESFVTDIDRLDTEAFVSASTDGSVAIWKVLSASGFEFETIDFPGTVYGVRVLPVPGERELTSGVGLKDLDQQEELARVKFLWLLMLGGGSRHRALHRGGFLFTRVRIFKAFLNFFG